MTRERITRCPALKYIGLMGTGTDGVDVDCARERGVAVCNVPAYGASSVAQHAFALLLHLTNNVPAHAAFTAAGLWSGDARYPFRERSHFELSGKTMGVFGYGSIARRFAGIARGFGMRVLISTEHPVPGDEGPAYRFTDADELLRAADVISLHKPLTEANRRMIDAAAFARMKPGVILINTARGGLIDEDALIDALESGKLRAAGLDVLAEEPPDPEHPLPRAKNCVVTPHIAWISEEARRSILEVTLSNLESWLGGGGQNRVELRRPHPLA
jgi:glycerate dehydrogenase